jgi:TDG/mug DNA glycosylase family protein
MSELIHCFPAIEDSACRVLVLGSMPGVASLQAQQYYAHPQNLFWKIAGNTFGFDPKSPYTTRTTALLAARVAVWDVLGSCARSGSLDAAIDRTSIMTNDFSSFFASHVHIERVCFNGGAAASIFARQVQPHLPRHLDLQYIRLPSTSPANASIPVADKLVAWATALKVA